MPMEKEVPLAYNKDIILIFKLHIYKGDVMKREFLKKSIILSLAGILTSSQIGITSYASEASDPADNFMGMETTTDANTETSMPSPSDIDACGAPTNPIPTHNSQEVNAIKKMIDQNGLTDPYGDEWISSWNYGVKKTEIINNEIRITQLDFSDNYKSIYGNLDLTAFSYLEELDISHTNVENVDITGLTKLQTLQLSNSKLTSIDVSHLSNLTFMDCSNTNIEVLDMSSFSLRSLKLLNCSNSKLKKLKFYNENEFDPGIYRLCANNSNDIYHPIPSSNPKLQELDCSNTELGTLDLSSCEQLTKLNCSNNPNLTQLDLSQNKNLAQLALNNIPVEKLTFPNGKELTVEHNNKSGGTVILDNFFYNPSGSIKGSLRTIPAPGMELDKWISSAGTLSGTSLDFTLDNNLKVMTFWKQVSITGICLDKQTLNMKKKDTAQLTAALTPSNTLHKVVWSSSNPAVANVSNTGKVTAISDGTATIIALCDNQMAMCNVTVTSLAPKPDAPTPDVPKPDAPTPDTPNPDAPAPIVPTPNPVLPKSISLSKKSLIIPEGKKVKLTATVLPANASNKSVTYSSSNKKVAKITKNGTLQALKTGTAVITAKTANHKSVTCKITVTKVQFNLSSVTLQTRQSTNALKVKSKYLSKDPVKSYKSSNSKIIKVDKKGKLTAQKKTGTAIITVTTKSGAKATCRVKVQKGIVKTSKLTLNKKSTTLKKGKCLQLTVTRNPITAKDKLTFQTSNSKVAKVDKKGRVTAVRKGTATITVKSSSGKKAQCKIKVK